MGFTSLHGQLTVSVLTELGFNRRAADFAAAANEEVDREENQTSEASKTKLHAMRGFLEGGSGPLSMRRRRMQTEQEAREAVDELLQSARQRTLQAIREGHFREALTELGAALHTVQDKEYHHFEPWPFDSVADSLFNARKAAAYGLPAHYMLQCHVPRDFGYVNGLLNLSLTALDYSAGYESGGGWSGQWRVELTQVSNNPLIPHLSLGYAGQTNGPAGAEHAVYGLLTWGRIPARPEAATVSPRSDRGTLAFQRSPALCSQGSEGANSLIAARQATVDYVNAIAQLAGRADWARFKLAQP
jgi:hypothetical protein